MKLTQERLKAVVSYDPLTGIFLWKERPLRIGRERTDKGWNSRYAHHVAGHSNGLYVLTSIDNHLYRAHHLAWLYMTGEWPPCFIDHRDLNGNNNSWANLRLATPSQNNANTRITSANSSGFKGVSFHSAGAECGKPWQASISKEGKQKALGIFATKEEAHAAYVTAAECLFGEFARAA